MDSPYKTPWRLQDVIAAIQVMGSSVWVTKRILEWEESLGPPRSAESWEKILRDHPEFFNVRISPWITGPNLNFDLLIAKLKLGDTRPSLYLMQQFSPSTRDLIDRHEVNTAVSEDLQTSLHKELNAIIRRREFSTDEAWQGRQLPADIEQKLDEVLPVDARMIRNRVLLEAEYPQEIRAEDFEPRAALTWRSAFDKNYNAEKAVKLTPAEMALEPFEVRDRLSRPPLDSEQVRSLITTALEMHSRVLASDRSLLDLQAEIRANEQEARAKLTQHDEHFQRMINEVRAEREDARADREGARRDKEDARADKQASRWWIPLAAALLSFVGAILGTILAAILKTK